MNCSRLLILLKRVLASAGVELEPPHVPVGSADYSATLLNYLNMIDEF